MIVFAMNGPPEFASCEFEFPGGASMRGLEVSAGPALRARKLCNVHPAAGNCHIKPRIGSVARAHVSQESADQRCNIRHCALAIGGIAVPCACFRNPFLLQRRSGCVRYARDMILKLGLNLPGLHLKAVCRINGA